MIGSFLVFSMLQFRDGPFIRPHPAFWRIMLGANLLYELTLVFLLFQELGSARDMMKLIDPSLGVPLPEKSYAENCELTRKNIWVSFFFVLSFSTFPDVYGEIGSVGYILCCSYVRCGVCIGIL